MTDPPDRLVLTPPGATRLRWALSALLGTTLALAVIVASHVVSSIAFGTLDGPAYAMVGLIQIALVPVAVWVGLRPVGLALADVGVRGPHVARDAALGLAIGTAFAVLQFGVIIPATGGASRSDIVMNAAQVGDSLAGVVGFVVLAWTGGVAEELLFRGHLLTTVRNALGPSRAALFGAAALVVIVFAALHGYQGWAGVIDTGIYGGVILTTLFVATGGRLTACTAAHAAWNTLATFGIYLWY